MILIVTYDLKQPAATYSGLYEVLKSKRSWWHYMKNTWLIATDDSPQELFDEIDFYIQKGDHILITTFSRPIQGMLPAKAWAWIKRYE